MGRAAPTLLAAQVSAFLQELVGQVSIPRASLGHVAGLYYHAQALEASCSFWRVHVHISAASTALVSRWLPLYETSFSTTSEAGKVQGIVYGYVHQVQTMKLAGASLVNKPMGHQGTRADLQRPVDPPQVLGAASPGGIRSSSLIAGSTSSVVQPRSSSLSGRSSAARSADAVRLTAPPTAAERVMDPRARGPASLGQAVLAIDARTRARTQRVQRAAKQEISRSLLRARTVADAAGRMSTEGGARSKDAEVQLPPVRADSRGSSVATEALSTSKRSPSNPQSQESGALAALDGEQILHDTTGIDQLLACADSGTGSDLNDVSNDGEERAGGEDVASMAVDAVPARGRSVEAVATQPQVTAEHVPSENATRFMEQLASSRLPYVESCRGALDVVGKALCSYFQVSTSHQLQLALKDVWPCLPAVARGRRQPYTTPQPCTVLVPNKFLLSTKRSRRVDDGVERVVTKRVMYGKSYDIRVVIATLMLMYDVDDVSRNAMTSFLSVRVAAPSVDYGTDPITEDASVTKPHSSMQAVALEQTMKDITAFYLGTEVDARKDGGADGSRDGGGGAAVQSGPVGSGASRHGGLSPCDAELDGIEEPSAGGTADGTDSRQECDGDASRNDGSVRGAAHVEAVAGIAGSSLSRANEREEPAAFGGASVVGDASEEGEDVHGRDASAGTATKRPPAGADGDVLPNAVPGDVGAASLDNDGSERGTVAAVAVPQDGGAVAPTGPRPAPRGCATPEFYTANAPVDEIAGHGGGAGPGESADAVPEDGEGGRVGDRGDSRGGDDGDGEAQPEEGYAAVAGDGVDARLEGCVDVQTGRQNVQGHGTVMVGMKLGGLDGSDADARARLRAADAIVGVQVGGIDGAQAGDGGADDAVGGQDGEGDVATDGHGGVGATDGGQVGGIDDAQAGDGGADDAVGGKAVQKDAAPDGRGRVGAPDGGQVGGIDDAQAGDGGANNAVSVLDVQGDALPDGHGGVGAPDGGQVGAIDGAQAGDGGADDAVGGQDGEGDVATDGHGGVGATDGGQVGAIDGAQAGDGGADDAVGGKAVQKDAVPDGRGGVGAPDGGQVGGIDDAQAGDGGADDAVRGKAVQGDALPDGRGGVGAADSGQVGGVNDAAASDGSVDAAVVVSDQLRRYTEYAPGSGAAVGTKASDRGRANQQGPPLGRPRAQADIRAARGAARGTLPMLSRAAQARHSARAASMLKACAMQAAAKVADAAASSKQSGVKRRSTRAAHQPAEKRVKFDSSLHFLGPGGVVRAALAPEDVSAPSSSATREDPGSTNSIDGGKSCCTVSKAGPAADAGQHPDAVEAKLVQDVPPFVRPVVKRGAARVSECAASISALSLRNAKRFQWPPLVRRATSIEPLLARDAGVYGIIEEKQRDCNFLLPAVDAERAMSTLTSATLRMRGSTRDRACVRVRWSGNAKQQPLDYTLTQRIVADMVSIHEVKAGIKNVLSTQAWLKAMRSLRQCPSGVRGRTCQCVRCDAGSDEAPLCEGRSVEHLIDDICSGLPLVTLKSLVFQYWGPSRHADRYAALTLDLNDVLEVLSSKWMTGAFLGAATVMLQEEAEAKGLPIHVMMCEESTSFIGCQGRPRTTAAAYQQCKRLARMINKAEKVLFLVNVGNSHWMSSEVDVVKKTVTVFDSLKTSGLELERIVSRIVMFAHTLFLQNHVPHDAALRKRFSLLLRKMPRDAESTAETRFKTEACKQWAVSMVHNPQQPDSYNCGAFAFMHLRHRLLGLPVKMTGGSGDAIRVKMVWDLMMGGRQYDKSRSENETKQAA